jgi:uncharacterized protein YdeI (YjbR/CyaY-like superfamily)
MGTRDKRVDAYIAKSADFAKPILGYLRETVHEACPDCEETLKWSAPTFMHHGMLCGFAAFKQHATFGFWKHELLLGERSREAMGSFGRLTSIKDLPSKRQLVALITKAMKLNEDGVKVTRMKAEPQRAVIRMPADLKSALAKNRKAIATYDSFSPSHKREYLQWITEAKSPETRARRLETALEWISEGKPRNWKYMRSR